MRQLPDLVDTSDPAWPAVREAIDSAPVMVEVLRGDRVRCDACLLRLQVSTRNVLGALVHQSGGVLIDEGWLRHLGGGAAGLPDVASANAMDDAGRPTAVPGALVVAHDVLGGRFAVNGTSLPGREGEVHYFAPDTLVWEPLGVDHPEFLAWSMSGATREFYDAFRWPGWEAEVRHVPLSHGLGLEPPPFAADAKRAAPLSRRPVPFDELLCRYDDAARRRAEG